MQEINQGDPNNPSQVRLPIDLLTRIVDYAFRVFDQFYQFFCGALKDFPIRPSEVFALNRSETFAWYFLASLLFSTSHFLFTSSIKGSALELLQRVFGGANNPEQWASPSTPNFYLLTEFLSVFVLGLATIFLMALFLKAFNKSVGFLFLAKICSAIWLMQAVLLFIIVLLVGLLNPTGYIFSYRDDVFSYGYVIAIVTPCALFLISILMYQPRLATPDTKQVGTWRGASYLVAALFTVVPSMVSLTLLFGIESASPLRFIVPGDCSTGENQCTIIAQSSYGIPVHISTIKIEASFSGQAAGKSMPIRFSFPIRLHSGTGKDFIETNEPTFIQITTPDQNDLGFKNQCEVFKAIRKQLPNDQFGPGEMITRVVGVDMVSKRPFLKKHFDFSKHRNDESKKSFVTKLLDFPQDHFVVDFSLSQWIIGQCDLRSASLNDK